MDGDAEAIELLLPPQLAATASPSAAAASPAVDEAVSSFTAPLTDRASPCADSRVAEEAELKSWEAEQLQLTRAAEAAREAELAEQLARNATSDLYSAAMHVLNETIAKAEQYHAIMTASEFVKQYLSSTELRALPESFTGTLRPYQEAGYSWLLERFLLGESGILADVSEAALLRRWLAPSEMGTRAVWCW